MEGTTDSDCLDPIVDYFKEQFKLTDLDIHIQGGDVFTESINNQKSGETILKEQVEVYLRQSKLTAKDILHVAFITDTDGIYIDPTDYHVDSSIVKFTYDLNNKKIICENEDKKRSLMQTRQTKVKKLSQVIREFEKSVLSISRADIPYSIYYNSLNLEHVLFDNILPNNEKTASLDNFLDSINDDPIKLMNIFKSKTLSDDYLESWELIKDCEMGQGYTNLNVLFNFLDVLSNNRA